MYTSGYDEIYGGSLRDYVNWHFIAGVFNDSGNEQRLFLDSVTPIASDNNSNSVSYSGSNIYIGHHPSETTYDMDGHLDEIHISNVARSNDWLGTHYYNLSDIDAFYGATASEESQGGATYIWDGGGSNNNWSTAENWSDDKAPVLASSATFNGTSNKACTIDTDVSIDELYILPGSSVTITLEGDLSVTQGIYLSSGIINAGSNLISLGGHWVKEDDVTFNAQASTVIFTGVSVSSITGSNTFYGLKSVSSGKEIHFSSGAVTSVTNMVEFQDVTLRSTLANATWYFTYTGSSQTIQSVDVKDSNAGGGYTIQADADSADSGNNTNWYFEGASGVGAGGSPKIAIYQTDTFGGVNYNLATYQNVEWDNTVSEDTDYYSRTGSTITLKETGLYLVNYSLTGDDGAGTNRAELEFYLQLDVNDLAYGRGWTYLRDTGGSDESHGQGSGIIYATANDELNLRCFRQDTNLAQGWLPRDKFAGISILKLDDSWACARYRYATTSAEDVFVAEANAVQLPFDTNDEQDTGFSRNGSTITIADAGYYLLAYNVGLDGTIHRSNTVGTVFINGSEVYGTRVTGYVRSSTEFDAGLSYVGIIKTSGTNDLLTIRLWNDLNDGTGTATLDNDDNTIGLTIIKLPDSGNYLRLYDSAGGQALDQNQTNLSFDAEQEKGSYFVHDTASTPEQIEIDYTGDYLFTWSAFGRQVNDNENTREHVWTYLTVDNSTKPWAQAGNYIRGDDGTRTRPSAGASAAAVLSLTDGEIVRLAQKNDGDDASSVFKSSCTALQAVEISSLLTGDVYAVNVSSHGSGSPSIPPATVTKTNTECIGTALFTGTGTVFQVTLTEYGSCDADNDLENVKLYKDDGDGNWESGQDTTQLGVTTNFNVSNKATISNLNLIASPTAYVHVVLDIKSDAVVDQTVGVELYESEIVVSSVTASAWPVRLGTAPIVSAGLSGTKEIGDSTGYDYWTITDAVAAMESEGLIGDITFEVYDDAGGYEGILLDSANISGAQDYVLTFRAAAGENPAISTGNINGHGVEIVNTFKQLIFNNIDISTTYGHGYYFNDETGDCELINGATIQNCTIENWAVDVELSGSGIRAYGLLDDIVISSNTFYADDGHCIYAYNISNIDIFNNTIYEGDGDCGFGIYIEQTDKNPSSDPSQVYSNVIYNVGPGTPQGIWLEGSSLGLQVYNNTIIGNGYSIRMASGFSGGSADSDHIVIYNNLMRNPIYNGIKMMGNNSNIDIYYNTIYGDSDDMGSESRACIHLEATVSECMVKNNIFLNEAAEIYGICINDVGNSTGTDNVVYDNNLYYSEADYGFRYVDDYASDISSWTALHTFSGWDANSAWGDPSFDGDGSFRIVSTSPANGLGTPITISQGYPIDILTDRFGNERGVYGLTSAGYHEQDYYTFSDQYFASSIKDGNWSSTDTWDVGGIPSSFTVVSITHTVTYDMNYLSGITCSSITIDNAGTLQFEQAQGDRGLILDGNLDIQSGGKLLMPPNTGYVSAISFKCDSAGEWGLLVQDGGQVDCRGNAMSYWRTTLSEQADSGQADLTTNDSTGWSVGDRVSIGPAASTTTVFESVIASISGTDITLEDNFDINRSTDAEVVNLTRNCLITSTGTDGGYPAYILIDSSVEDDVVFEWTEMSYLGSNNADKYGIGFNSVGSIAKFNYCSIHDGYYGVNMENAHEAELKYSAVGNNAEYGIKTDSDSHDLLIEGNSVFGSRSSGALDGGLKLVQLTDSRILSNRVYANYKDGIHFYTGYDNVVSGNYTYSNIDDGIAFYLGGYNTAINNTVFNNGGAGLEIASSGGPAWNNLLCNNESYANEDGISIGNNTAKENIVAFSEFYGNSNYGFMSSNSANNNTLISCNFGNGTENSLADIDYDGSPGIDSLVLKNCLLGSTNEVSSGQPNTAGEYIVSFLHDNVPGKTKIWGDYAISGSTQQFNYADVIYRSTVTLCLNNMDSDEIIEGIVTDDSKTETELWEVKCTADGGTGSFTVKHGTGTVLELDSDSPAEEGTPYTSTDRGVQFTIPAAAYEVDEAFYFLTISSSNDQNTQKVIEFDHCDSGAMGDKSRLTVEAGAGLEMIGSSSYPTIATAAVAGQYFHFDISGTINASNYSFTALRSSGVYVVPGANIIDLSSGTYDIIEQAGGTSSSTYINVSGLTQDATFYGMVFNNSSDLTYINNVLANGAGIDWTINGVGGDVWGADYEKELNSAAINWVAVNQAPVLGYSSDNTLGAASQSSAQAALNILFRVKDMNGPSDTSSLASGSCQYSTNGGGDWSDAGDANVAFSPSAAFVPAGNWTGTEYTLIWYSTNNFNYQQQNNVKFRFKVNDGDVDSAYAETAAFTVDNTVESGGGALDGGWYDTDWQYRRLITILNENVPNTNQVDFPVLISTQIINFYNGGSGHVQQSDGGDILFTSTDGVKFYHEIEEFTSFASSGALVAWVRVSTVSASVNTPLYMYYGNASCSDQWHTTNTWNSHYLGVWHLDESPSDGGTHEDSSGSGNHGTYENNSGGGDSSVLGKISGANEFDGNSSNGAYISINNNMDIPPGGSGDDGMTISLWVNPGAFSPADMRMISKANGTSDSNHWWMISMIDDSGDSWRVRHKTDPTGTDTYIPSGDKFDPGSWYYLTVTFDGDRLRMYRNTTLDLNSDQDNEPTAQSGSISVNIARNPDGYGEFDGIIDEVRISDIALSADWIATEYNNQNWPSTFTVLGSEEEYSPSGVPYLSSIKNGDWNSADTWDLGVTPSSFTVVNITHTVTYHEYSTTTVKVSSITIGNLGTLQFDQGYYDRCMIVDGNIRVESGGKLLLPSNTGYVSTIKFNCDTVGEWGLLVDNGGELKVEGYSDSYKNIISATSTTSNHYFDFIVSGTIDASYYSFEYMNSSGVYIVDSATVVDLSSGTYDYAYDNDPSSSAYITVEGINSTKTFYDLDFGNSSSLDTLFNIKADGANIAWTINGDSTTARWGADYESEENSAFIEWTYPGDYEDGIYVDGVDGDDSGGTGTPSQPYKTIGKAITELSGQGTVLIKGGTTYYEQVNLTSSHSGIQGSTTVIKAWPDTGRPVIKNSGGTTIVFNNADYIELLNLNVADSGDQGISLGSGSDNNIIRQCAVYGSGAAAIAIADGGGAENLLVSHCVLYANTNDGVWGGISNSGSNSVKNSIIVGNKWGYDTNSSNIVSDYNDVYANTTDYDGVTPGSNDMSVNPGFVDPANRDFRLWTGSGLIGEAEGGSDMGIYPDGPTVASSNNTYYIRPDGDDSNDGLSNNSGGAWRTISYSTSVVQAGDTVIVASGTYNESPVISCSAIPSSTITYYADGNVIIAASGTYGMKFSYAQGVFLRNFNFTGASADGMVLSNSSNINIEGVKSYANTGSGLLIENNSSNNIIRRSAFYGNGTIGIYITGGSNMEIYNCVLYDNNNDGIYSGSDSYSHTVRNCIAIDNDWGFDDNETNGIDSDYNNAYNNTTSDYGDASSGDNDLSSEAYFVKPSSRSSSITATVLTNSAASYVTDEFIGMTLNPDTTQGVSFLITDNDATTITVSTEAIGQDLTDVATVNDVYEIHDFHLQSPKGSWHGGTWAYDANYSTGIDNGDPGDDIGSEPAPNGSIINMGIYGGTAEASKTWGALAGTYKVGKTGDYDYWTITAAVAAMETEDLAGDVVFEVYDDPGGYEGILLDSANISGAQDYVITFQATQATEQPTISTGNVNGHGIEVVNTFKQLNFNNIDISTTYGHGYYFNGVDGSCKLLSGATIQNCTIENYDNTENKRDYHGIFFKGETDGDLPNILISSNTVYLDGNSGIAVSTANHVTIAHNTMPAGESGIFAISVNALGKNGSDSSEIYANETYGANSWVWVSGELMVNGYCPGLKIYDNRLFGGGTYAFFGILSLADGSSANEDHIVIYNNVISSAMLHGISLYSEGSYVDCYYNTLCVNDEMVAYSQIALNIGRDNQYITAKNNILYDANTSTDSYSIVVSSVNTSNITIDNNVHYCANSEGRLLRYGTTSYYDLSSWTSAHGWDANSVEGWPAFTDFAGADYSLQNHSPAQALGTQITTPISIDEDYEDTNRDDSTPDAGYDENLASPIMSGTYNVGGGSPMHFISLAGAVQGMELHGINGNVTFEVYDDQGDYDGILLDSANISGAQDYVITFQATQATEQPTISTGNTNGHGIEIVNTFKQINFNNIDISTTCAHGYYFNDETGNCSLISGATIQNCSIENWDKDDTGTKGGIYISASGSALQNIYISSNTFSWDAEYCIYANTCEFLKIIDNTFNGGDGDGEYAIRLTNCDNGDNSDRSEVYGNTIYDPEGTRYSYAIRTEQSNDGLLIYDNKIYGSTQLDVGISVNGTPNNSTADDYVVVYNNLIVNAQANAILSGTSLRYTDLYFNTCYADSDDVTGASEGLIEIDANTLDFTCKNNIFINESSGDQGHCIFDKGNSTGTDNVIYDNNLYYSLAAYGFRYVNDYASDLSSWTALTDTGWDGSSEWGEPGFNIDGSFHIVSTSPANGLGTQITSPISIDVDYFGTNRNDSYPDAGFHEMLTAPPALSSFTYIAPENNVWTNEKRPSFNWAASTNTIEGYRFEIDNNADFSSVTESSDTLNTSVRLSAELSEGTYYWRVRAYNLPSWTIGWSTWTIGVDLTAPGNFQDIASKNGSSVWIDTDTLNNDYSPDVRVAFQDTGSGLVTGLDSPSFSSATVLLLHFDENTSSAVYDASGNGNNGEIVDDDGDEWISAVNNSGLQFETNGEYIAIPNSDSLDIAGTTFTVSFWLNADANAQVLFGKWYNDAMTDPFYQYGVEISPLSNGELSFQYSEGGSVVWFNTDNGTLDFGSWDHYALTYNGINMKWYKNGAEIKSKEESDSFEARGRPLWIGQDRNSNQDFTGKLDEFQIWNRCLSQEEIAVMCNSSCIKYTINSWGSETFTVDTDTVKTTGATGTTELQYSTASGVFFNNASSSANRIRFMARDRAGNIGISESFTIPTGAGTIEIDPTIMPVEHYAPVSGTWMNEPLPSFNWEASTITDLNYYSLEVDNDADFSSPLISVYPSAEIWEATANLTAASYYWRVRVIDDQGYWSTNWSTWTFGVDYTGPSVDNIEHDNSASVWRDTGTASDQTELDIRWEMQDDDSGLSVNMSPPVLSSGTVLLMHFTDNATDYSGHEYNATYNNGAGSSWPAGLFGNAIELDADADVVLAHKDSLSMNGKDYTVKAWVMADNSVSGYHCIMFKQTSYGLHILNGGIDSFIHDGGYSDHATGDLGIDVGEWHYVATVFDNTNDRMKIYLDGEKVYDEEETGEPDNNTNSLYIGSTDGSEYLYGKIDELQILKRALSDDEIAADFNSSSMRYSTNSWSTENLVVDTDTIKTNGSDGSTSVQLSTATSIDLVNYSTTQNQIKIIARDMAGNVTTSSAYVIKSDSIAPAGISNLTALSAGDTSIKLEWTSPGDDGADSNLGSGSKFRIKYSTVGQITASNFDSPPAAYAVTTVDISTEATTLSYQTTTFAGLLEDTGYWFAIKTMDPAGNWSVWNSSGDVLTVNTSAYYYLPAVGLSGSYNVGKTGDYSYWTITSAVAAMEAEGIIGNITFDVYDDAGGYEGILLDGDNIDGSTDYSITFRAIAAGVQPYIDSGNTNGNGIQVQNAFKQLNFNNIDITAVTGEGYLFASGSLLLGATIQNCSISGYDSNNNEDAAAIRINGEDFDKVLISSNTITWDDYYAVRVQDADALTIRNNTVNAGDGNDRMAFGINASSSVLTQVTEIYGNTVNDPANAGEVTYGIQLSGNCRGVRVYENMFLGETNLDIGIYFYGDGANSDIEKNVVYNNIIKHPQGAGIFTYGDPKYNDAYFNTIYADENDLDGATEGCVKMIQYSSHTVIKNNVICNMSPGTNGLLIFDQGNTAGDGVVYDYNLYYSRATNKFKRISSNYGTLGDWQGLGSSWDENSVFGDPMFVSTQTNNFNVSDLSYAQAISTPISSPISITTDYSGTSRDNDNPDAGAYENTSQVTGSYNVGGPGLGYDIHTLTGAVDAMGRVGLSGNVTWEVYDDNGAYDGILLDSANISGAQNYTITFQATIATEQPTISTGNINGHGIEVVRKFKQLNFNNIDISTTSGHGYYFNGETDSCELTGGATIQNCTIRGWDWDGSAGNMSGIIIDGEDIDDVLISSNTFYCDDYNAIRIDTADNIDVYANTFYEGDGDAGYAISVKSSTQSAGSPTRIHENTIYNFDDGNETGIYIDAACYGLQVYNNTIDEVAKGIYLNGADGGTAASDHIVIYNNLLTNMHSEGFSWHWNVTNADAYFNTIHGVIDWSGGYSLRVDSDVSSATFKNNIIFNDAAETYSLCIYDKGNSTGPDNVIYDNNLYFSSSTYKFRYVDDYAQSFSSWTELSNTGWDANSVYGNPYFVDLVNFRVENFSPAQANAAPITTAGGYPIDITTDFEGHNRNGSTPDIGYDENLAAVPTNDFLTKVKTLDDPLEWEWRVPVSTDIIQSWHYTRPDVFEYEWRQLNPGSGKEIIHRPLSADATYWYWTAE
jgi:hypothetical protein